VAVMNQGDAADGLQAFGAKDANDFGVVRVKFGASRNRGNVAIACPQRCRRNQVA
jgi:hypothetical protein